MENELKQRNGCISIWLWLALIANLGMTGYYAIDMFDQSSGEGALGMGLLSIFLLINALGCIQLLRWNKIGFYMMVIASVLGSIVNVSVLHLPPTAMLSTLFGIVIWWAILQMKKDGESAWSQLDSGWDTKHCRHLYQLFGAVAFILFLLTMIAFIKANDPDDPEEPVVIVDDDRDLEKFVEDSLVTEDDIIVPVEPEIREEQSPKNTEKQKEDSRKVKENDEKPSRPEPEPASAKDEDVEKHLRFLKETIAEVNKNFPQKAAEGMVMKRCYLDGEYIMYLAECDEDLYDIDILNMNKSDMKKAIRNELSSNSDPLMAYFLKMCVKAHKGFGLKYTGDTTGKSCIVKVPYTELTSTK